MFKRIDHIAIVVPDLDEVIALYESHFGVSFAWRTVNDTAGFEAAAFYLETAHVEFLQPTRPDTPISRFLEKYNGGIHHIAFEVDDASAAFQGLRDRGLPILSEQLLEGTGGSQIFFIHPKATMGTLIEMIQPKSSEEAST